jgi:hypothetical protein
VALILGVVLGLLSTSASLGVGISHLACGTGPVIGTSGPTVSPWEVALAPPGGLVNESWSINWNYSESSAGLSGYSDPANHNSTYSFELYNWTLEGSRNREIPGWGPTVTCPSQYLSAALSRGTVGGGCGGCLLADGVPGTVGERTTMPEQTFYGSAGSVLMNGSYSAAPVASITFQKVDGGLEESNPGDFAGLPVIVKPSYENRSLFGIEFSYVTHYIHFGVPIRLLSNSSNVEVSGTIPTDLAPPPGLESLSFTIRLEYILPASTTPETWDVYAAGAGSPFSIGGLLFERTA